MYLRSQIFSLNTSNFTSVHMFFSNFTIVHMFQTQIWQSKHVVVKYVWWVHQILEGRFYIGIYMVKFVFETDAQVKFEVNLKGKDNCVNSPLYMHQMYEWNK